MLDRTSPIAIHLTGGRAEQLGLAPVLLRRIQQLDFEPLAELVCRVLAVEGYRQIERLSRRTYKGRHRDGGVDITALIPGLGRARLIVQIKHHAGPVAKVSVDEVRGAAFRCSASQAGLVSTTPFSDLARIAALRGPLLPVWLLDGERLATLCIHHRLGVTEEPVSLLRLDEPYFQDLEA